MEDRSKHIDDLFREGLGDYQETPPPGVWDSLEQRLPAGSAEVAKKSPDRRWLWLLLLLLLLATVGYILLRSSSNDESNTSPQLPQMEQPAPVPESPVADSSMDEGWEMLDGTEGFSSDNDTDPEVFESNGRNRDGSGARVRRSGDRNAAPGGRTNRSDASRRQSTGNADQGNAKQGAAPRNGAGQREAQQETGTRGSNPTGSTRQGPGSTQQSTGNNHQSATGDRQRAGLQNGIDAGSNQQSQNQNTANKPGTSPAVASRRGTNQQGVSQPATAQTPETQKSNQPADPSARGGAGKTTPGSGASVSKSQNTAQNATQGGAQSGTLARANQPARNANGSEAAERSATTDNTSSRSNQETTKTTSGAAATETRETANRMQSSAAVPVNTASRTGAPKSVTPASATSKRTGVVVKDHPAGTPEPVVPPTPPAPKNQVLKMGGNKPAAPPDVKVKDREEVFKRTESGYVINTPVVDDLEPEPAEEEAPEDVELAANIDAVPEEAEEEVQMPLLATGSNPNPGGGGGGGATATARVFPRLNQIRLEGGVKAGYEMGLSNFSTRSPVVSPYLQWNVSRKVSFVLMPSFRYNTINMMELFAQEAFHRHQSATIDSFHIQSVDTFQGPLIQRNYIYRNIYDSILAGYNVNQQNFWEFDLPILLKYRLTPKLSALLGPYLTFGNHIQIAPDIREYNGIQRLDTLSYAPVVDSSQMPGGIPTSYPYPPAPEDYFQYGTPVYTGAPPPTAKNPASNPARFGLMFGLSMEIGKRVMIDLLLRQNVSDLRYIPNDKVRKVYASPYMRATVGVKLFETGNRQPRNPNGL